MAPELLILGGTLAGLSTAVQARRAGVSNLHVLRLANADDRYLLELRGLLFDEPTHVHQVVGRHGRLVVDAGGENIEASTLLIDVRQPPVRDLPWSIPHIVGERIHHHVEFDAEDKDVLVVGSGESAIAAAARLVERKSRVVLAFDGESSGLSLLGEQLLERFEREQVVTVLWQSQVETIWAVDGYPMARFNNRRTPDLQFDHVVNAVAPDTLKLPFPVDIDEQSRTAVFVMRERAYDSGSWIDVTPSTAWTEIQRRRFPNLPVPLRSHVTRMSSHERRELAGKHYNATITTFDTAHNELWRIRLRPDRQAISHSPGQYCSIGLGYWEPRADNATDSALEAKIHKLIRRSYSISSPMIDDHGYLADRTESDEIELYIVWVQPNGDRIPALTPRLALKNVGDRIYLGPKVAGRYSIMPVTNPHAPLLFVATGTGEAPHNAMIVELLRKGHRGPILAVVSVRYWSDLAYLSEHRSLEAAYENYRYLPIPTREAGQPKRYAQDLLDSGVIEETLGTDLDPSVSHVFLCGNPEMIGLPEWSDDEPTFPTRRGMAELLHDRGFTLDRRSTIGNVHYEEYW